MVISGCGGGSTPPPPVSVTIAPTSANVQTGQQKQFTATVSNTTNTAVTWQVNSVTGGDSIHGTITASGLFIAPASVPNPATVTVTAVSQADNTKSSSAMVTITAPPDKTPPTAPTNLTASAISNSQINLSWTASTDNVGVTGYKVERCQGANCSNFSPIATPVGTSYNDTGLTASTSYSYRVRATDAAGNLSNYSNIAIAITQASSTGISVTISPKRGGLTITQSLSVTATVANDSSNQGVTWSATGGGTFSAASSTSGTPVTYTAPATAGVATITATSNADTTKSSSATIGVTDLPGVLTYHNDLSRDGVNSQEYALNTSNVASGAFGKLFTCTADGAIYAQPLWIANLTINGAKHNVVIVATQHDSVYAFDADANPCQQLWHANLLDTVHGANSGETPVPSGPTGNLVGNGYGDITPEVGVTGTPVIDPSTNTLYVVSKSVNVSATTTFFQRLHALSLIDGSEKFGGPANITSSITVPGTGDGSSGGTVAFDPRNENQRPGLTLINGVVYVSWASHEDAAPFHGWVIGFSASNLNIVSVFNDTPNGSDGGIWMGGGAPAADSNNNLFLITGNGTFDTSLTTPADLGDSFLRLATSSGISPADWFTPSDEQNRNNTDADLGAGGAMVLVDLPSPPPAPSSQHLLVGSGKAGMDAAGHTGGILYLLNRDSLGHFTPNNSGIVQSFAVSPNGVYSTPAFWQDTLYILPRNDSVKAFNLNPSTGLFNTTPASQSSNSYGFRNGGPSLSASGTTNGILWAIDSTDFCTPSFPTPPCGPAVLHAYDATNLGSELWNSSLGSGNSAGNAVKFTVPTVANGKVYVGTRGNNTGGATTSTSVPGELDVYGLLPN
jgi:hypothetical protein